MWPRPEGRLSLVVTVLLLLNLSCYVLAQDDDPFSIKKFNDLRLNDPASLCLYVKCLSPVKTCPEDTFWIENVALYGCCGGCVQFKGVAEYDCTGSIDPNFNDGYCEDVDGELSCPEYSVSLRAKTANANLRTSDTNANVIESSWCGYGLQCSSVPNSDITLCYIPSSGDSASKTCREARDALLSFTTGYDYIEESDDYLWIPECTLDGLYQPKQCKGPAEDERCVCVTPTGDSIYGSAFPFQEELYDTMNCECSRRVWEQQQNGIDFPTLHCLENGNYEPIQCENGYCYCIDPNTTVTYGPTVPEKAMFILPCYNKTLLGEADKYLRLCDSKGHAHSSLREFVLGKGVEDAPLQTVSCDPDGSFSNMQCVGAKCDCVDKFGNKYPESTTKKEFGCNCMRDETLLANQNKEIMCKGGAGGYYLYHSDANGAYCVDEHGIRSSPKVKPEFCGLLGCNDAFSCRNGFTSQCRKVCQYHEEECPLCVYASYKGEDTSECDALHVPDSDNLKCTDAFNGN